jgi:hypothetical protein
MGVFGIVGNAADGNLAGYGRYEPKRKDLFTVEFSAIVSGSPIDTLLKTTGASLTHAVQSVSQLTNAITPISLKHGNEIWNVAGKSRNGQETIDVTFHDILPKVPTGDTLMDAYPQYSASAIMYDWQNIIQNIHTADAGLAGDYKANMFLKNYAPNGTIVEQYMVHGIFPSNLAGQDFNYESDGEAQIFSATFSVDKVFRIATDDTAEPSEVKGIVAEQ